MEWMECPVIERVPGKISGLPVLRKSRVRPEDVVANAGQGAEWIADAFDLPLDQVHTVLRFYAAHKDQLAAAV